MTIFLLGHTFEYEVLNLCKMFFHGVDMKLLYEKTDVGEDGAPLGDTITTEVIKQGEIQVLSVTVSIGDKTVERAGKAPLCSSEKDLELALCTLLYQALEEHTGISLKWGLLTGIRPAKMVRHMRADGVEDEEIRRRFQEDFFVSKEKTDLCFDVVKNERLILRRNRKDSFSIYISIPFCPTRCLYCSFVSHSIKKANRLLGDYCEKLVEELRETGKLVKAQGLHLETVYIGGGTPTILSPEQIRLITGAIRENFDLSDICEYTMEAGRPDTIDEEKLIAMKEAGITRISINPQSFNDHVLETIGRPHTGQDVIDKFFLARKVGFTNINMDLIAGLPEDTLASFQATIRQTIDLGPENITLHTLSVKRSSRLKKEYDAKGYEFDEMVAAMTSFAYNAFREAGYGPYYMYRQKNTRGNLENVGYAKAGLESPYNVYIMDETHSIIAMGAGAVSKLVDQESGRIQRIFNYKYPYEYLSRFDTVLERKRKELCQHE